jgi:hypothetical protein
MDNSRKQGFVEFVEEMKEKYGDLDAFEKSMRQKDVEKKQSLTKDKKVTPHTERVIEDLKAAKLQQPEDADAIDKLILRAQNFEFDDELEPLAMTNLVDAIAQLKVIPKHIEDGITSGRYEWEV